MCSRLARVAKTEVDMAVCDDSRRAADRIFDEYEQLPGLSLTSEQATRLLGLDRPLVVAVLEELERDAFLVRSGRR